MHFIRDLPVGIQYRGAHLSLEAPCVYESNLTSEIVVLADNKTAQFREVNDPTSTSTSDGTLGKPSESSKNEL